MKKGTVIWIIILVIIVVGIVLIVSKHGTSYSTTPSTSSAPFIPAGNTSPGTGTSTVTPQGTVVLGTSVTSALGTYLVAQNGMTLYKYSSDTAGVSNCTGACASNWPPYTIGAATAMPLLGQPGVTGTIATITRTDGSMQVTYNGMPLYFFASDSKAGDATGQNKAGFTVVTP